MVFKSCAMKALHMVLKPCAKPPKHPMVLLYMVQEGLANGFKTMCKALHMVLKHVPGLAYGFKTMYGEIL